MKAFCWEILILSGLARWKSHRMAFAMVGPKERCLMSMLDALRAAYSAQPTLSDLAPSSAASKAMRRGLNSAK